MKQVLKLSLMRYSTGSNNLFKLANEADTGQDTTNPFIICKRALNAGTPIDLKTLNSILAFNNISITQAEFDYLLSIKPTVLPMFPFPVNDESVINSIGSATKKGDRPPKSGVYLIESLDGADKYVGSSNMLAMRLRYYYSKKGMGENRPVAKSLVSRGLDKFNVSVFLLEQSDLTKLGLSISMQDLTLAFEQLMILRVNPNLNVMSVVNGFLPTHSTYKQVGNPVYIYNNTIDTLLYTAESAMQIEKEIKITPHSMSRNMKSGSPMYGKYVFTRTPIEGANVSLMSSSALRADLDWCYQNRAQLRDYSKPTRNMIPIILTDLIEKKSYTFISKRRACLFTTTFSIDRHVNQLDVAKLKLPFTYNSWLFEVNNNTA